MKAELQATKRLNKQTAPLGATNYIKVLTTRMRSFFKFVTLSSLPQKRYKNAIIFYPKIYKQPVCRAKGKERDVIF
jgi:hypothetical protein